MKLKLASTFLDLDGNDMKNEKGQILTLYEVLRMAVTMELPEDTKEGVASVENKMKNFDMYLEINKLGKEGELEITSDQATYLKPRVAKMYTVLIAGPLLKMLDGKLPY